jgi:hypothetical protein
MTPAIVMAVAPSVEIRAINVTVHDTPHDRSAIVIHHRKIDIAIDDAANDRPVIDMANHHRAAVPITIAEPAAIALAPSGFSRGSSEATQENGSQHREEFQFARHERVPTKLTTRTMRALA